MVRFRQLKSTNSRCGALAGVASDSAMNKKRLRLAISYSISSRCPPPTMSTCDRACRQSKLTALFLAACRRIWKAANAKDLARDDHPGSARWPGHFAQFMKIRPPYMDQALSALIEDVYARRLEKFDVRHQEEIWYSFSASPESALTCDCSREPVSCQFSLLKCFL